MKNCGRKLKDHQCAQYPNLVKYIKEKFYNQGKISQPSGNVVEENQKI